MNASEDTDTIEWVRTLAELPDPPEPSTEVVLHDPGYTQTEWDRHHVRQLQAVEDTIAHLWDNADKPDSVLIRDALLLLGRERAARDHMAATAHEDARSHYAAMYGKPEPKPKPQRRKRAVKAIEPSRVISPGQRRKPGGAS